MKVQWYQIRTTAIKKQNQSDQETANCEVQCFQKTSKQSNKVLQSFHVIPGSSLCFGFKIEELGFEKQSKSTKKTKEPILNVFHFSQKCPYDLHDDFHSRVHHIRALCVQWHQNQMTVI